jgi:hypothetical protein
VSSRGHRLSRLLALAALGAALAAPAGAKAQAPPLPPDFVGMNAAKGDVVQSSSERRIKVLGDIAATRVQIMREPFDWALVEREPGQLDFEFYDALVAEAARHGLRVLPTLQDPPDWRSTRPDSVERRIMYPPKSNAEMANFASVMAARYGPGGSFWTSNPQLPQIPIVSWQVWNEPNIPVFWGQQPNAAEYTDLLADVSAAIRQVQPQAEIVTAGLTYSPMGPTAPTFLESMYRAGAQGTFDTLAVHPYSHDDRTVAALIGDARAVLHDHGDDAKIWVTEFGWATGDPSKNSHWHTDQAQARLIGDTIARLGTVREQLGIRGFDYFYWAETAPSADPSENDPLWGHVGLLHYGDEPKPGFFAFRDGVADLLDGRHPPDPGPYRQDPVRIGRLKVAPKRFASARWAQVATRRRPHGSRGRRGGSELTFRAGRTGMVLLTVERTRHGHRRQLGTARLVVYEGRNRVLLSGSVHGRALQPGPYRVRVGDASGHGRSSKVGFQIVRPPRSRR